MNTIYFDFDGTLHNTSIIYQKAVNYSYKCLQSKIDLPNRTVTVEQCDKWLGLTPQQMWDNFIPDLDKSLQEEASTLVGEKMKAQLENGEGTLYNNVINTLETLVARGYQINILSNCKNSYAEIVTEVFELYKYINNFYTAEQFDYKPKNEIISQLQSELNENIVAFVGDRKADIDAGKYNNIVTIACKYGFGSEEEIQEADFFIQNINEILNIVD